MFQRKALFAILISSTGCLTGVSVATADTADLELAFNNHCRECHSVGKDDNRLGPSLYGVVGRKAATQPGYNYSPALRDSGLVWTDKVLDQWIANPGAVAAGNNMQPPYPGVADPAERAKIIAYLKGDTAGGSAYPK